MQSTVLPRNRLRRVLVVLGTPVAIVFIAGLFAVSEVYTGFSFFLTPVFLGATGALTAFFWRKHFNLPTIVIFMVAIVAALLTYLVYRYAEYRLELPNLRLGSVLSFTQYVERRVLGDISEPRPGSAFNLSGLVEILIVFVTSMLGAVIEPDSSARTRRQSESG